MTEFIKHDKNRVPLPRVDIHLKYYDKDLDNKTYILKESLLDDGSQLSFISSIIVDKYKLATEKVEPLQITNAAKQNIAVCNKAVRNVNLYIPLYGIELIDAELYVMNNLTDRSCIIGLDCLRPIRKSLNKTDPIYLNDPFVNKAKIVHYKNNNDHVEQMVK